MAIPRELRKREAPELYSWGWLAGELAGGVVSGLAGKIITEIVFGQRDIVEMVNQFSVAVQQIVRREIAVDRLRAVVANCESLTDLLSLYANSQDRTFIVPMQIKASDIVNESASLGFPATASFGIAGGVMLTILHDVYNHDPSAGNHQNIIQYSRRLLLRYHDIWDDLRVFNRSRFGGLTNDIGDNHWHFSLDGEFIDTGIPIPTDTHQIAAKAFQKEAMESEADRIYAGTLGKLVDASNRWYKLAWG